MSSDLIAGRELDALIAEKVMGQNPHWLGLGDEEILSIGESGRELPHYSTDIAAAWKIVEKLQASHPPAQADCWPAEDTTWHLVLSFDDEWENVKMLPNFPKTPKWEAAFDNGCGSLYVYADTAPHAICLAALKAVAAPS